MAKIRPTTKPSVTYPKAKPGPIKQTPIKKVPLPKR